jgi:hypothetical protein
MAEDERACPKCGSTDVQAAGVLRRHVNHWAIFFGGWLLAALWSGSRKEEVRCAQCDTVFQRATRASKIAWILFLVLLALVLLGLWEELFGKG